MSIELSARRDELVGIALLVLERDGVDRFSLGEVAREAGVKPPSLYKQFDGKTDVEDALIELGFRMQGDTMERAMSALGPAPTRRMTVEILARAYRDFGFRHPQLYRLMHERPLPASLPREVYEARAVAYRALFTDQTLSTSLWAWAHGLLTLELAGRFSDEVDIDDLWRVLVDHISVETG